VSLTPRRWPWPSGSPAFTWTRACWRVPLLVAEIAPLLDGPPASFPLAAEAGQALAVDDHSPLGWRIRTWGPGRAPAFCESVWFVG
jgi:hypothetical protein